jgi:peptidoglycan/xylan/chitin deacetylase (PgdA/CDA1 family)
MMDTVMKKLLKRMLVLIFPQSFVLSRVKGCSTEIALTFDDGPHPLYTKRLLQVLADEGIKATFFLSGSEIEKFPELAEAIALQGHEIANHSFSHNRMSEIGFSSYLKGVLRTSTLTSRFQKNMVRLFRSPYGEMNLKFIWLILRHRYKYVKWSIDSRDSFIEIERELIECIRKTSIQAGDILLFHEDYPTTLAAMPDIVKGLKARGFCCVRLSELLERKV